MDIMIAFDHRAFAREVFEAAVQVSKIIHAARMPRARERVTQRWLCLNVAQRKKPTGGCVVGFGIRTVNA
ncbi:hypothetical protein WI74_33415 [Burkholderia ubonensis]|nr:hypothetical protein WI74_33415 [Burkholderia ubonensis]